MANGVSFYGLTPLQYQILSRLGTTSPARWTVRQGPPPRRNNLSLGFQRLFALVPDSLIQEQIIFYEAEYDQKLAKHLVGHTAFLARQAKRDAKTHEKEFQEWIGARR